jgi:hypothetical protein
VDPIIVDTPDGGTAEFPAGTPLDVIKGALAKRFPKPAPERSLLRQGLDAFEDQAKWQRTRMVNAGAGLVGLAADAGPLGPVRRIVQAVAPSIAPGTPGTVLDYAYPDARTARDFAYRTAGMDNVSLPGGVGRVVDAGVEAAILAPAFPGGARNLLPGFTGGAASEAGGVLTEGTKYEPAARITGAVLGGGIGALAQGGLERTVNAGREALRPLTTDGARRTAGNVLADLSTDPASVRTSLATAPREIVPGSHPTTARLTNDPGLLATENVLAGGAGRGGEFVLRAADNAARRMEVLNRTQPGGSVANTADFFRSQVQAMRGHLSQADAQAAARVQAALDALPPGATPQQAGDAIRTALQQRVDILTTVRADASRPLYDAARASDANVPPTGALATLNREGATAVGGTAGRIEAVTKYLTRPDGTPRSTIAELDAAFKQLGDDIAAARATGASNEVRILEAVKAQVESAMRGEPLYDAAKGVYSGLSRPLDKYQAPQAPNVASTLERDPRAGTYALPADVVPQQFLRQGPAGAASMREFVAAAGPAARETMKAHIAEAVRALPPGQIDGYIRRHAGALRELDPMFEGQLREIVHQQGRAAAVARQTTDAGKALDRSAPSGFVSGDAEGAVGAALRAKDARSRMSALVTEASRDTSGAALDGLRRGIVDDFASSIRTTATDARGNPGTSAAAAVKWWRANSDAIRPALTPQQFDDITRVVADAARDARSAPRVAGSDTMRNLDTNSVIATRIAAAIVGPRWANSPLAQTAMRPVSWALKIPETHVRNALTDMALNPDLAARYFPNAARAEGLRLPVESGNAFARFGRGVARNQPFVAGAGLPTLDVIHQSSR